MRHTCWTLDELSVRKQVLTRFHSRDGRTDGVDYQCYTSVNRGSVAKRLNKGISIEHSCESPYIQGWKLEMMAEQVFDRYIENADKVIDLSYAMLEKHIADQETAGQYRCYPAQTTKSRS